MGLLKRKIILLVPVLIALAFVPVFAQLDEIVPINPRPNTQTIENKIIQLVNDYRAQNGLNTLTHDSKISGIARSHSQDQFERDYFDHNTLGTNKGPNLRGSLAGYGICGDPVSVQRYHAVNNDIHTYNSKLNEYDRLLQALKRGVLPNAEQIQRKLVQDGVDIDNMYDRISNDIDVVNGDIMMRKVGIGFAENIMLFENPVTRSDDRIASDTLTGWVNSPGHKAVLESYVGLIGVGVVGDGSKLIVTLNLC